MIFWDESRFGSSCLDLYTDSGSGSCSKKIKFILNFFSYWWKDPELDPAWPPGLIPIPNVCHVPDPPYFSLQYRIRLKVLSSEMDPAKIRFIRVAIKEWSAHPPCCESPLKLHHHLIQLLVIWKQIANSAHSSGSYLETNCQQRPQLCQRPYSLHTAVGNGAMSTFGICY